MIGLVWLSVIVFALVMYSVLGGYSIGLGIALLLQRGPERRRAVAEVIGSAWDGNETWLILVAVALWGGFPSVFGILLPHLFIPAVVMLLAIGVRGLSIELATASPRSSGWVWTIGFTSLVITAAQGLMLGATTQVIPTARGAYAGSGVEFFSPMSVVTALMLLLVVAVQGTAFLRFKAVGEMRDRAAAQGRVLTGFALLLVAVAAIGLQATPAALMLDRVERLLPWVLAVLLVAVAGAVCWWMFPRESGRRATTPFLAVVVAVVAGWVALAAGRVPVLLPPDLTVAAAQSPENAVDFLLVGVGLNLPLLLVYNWHAYRVFRGPLKPSPAARPPGRSLTSAALAPRDSSATAS